MPEVTCVRCGEARPALEQPPMPGAYGEIVKEQVCGPCWREWQAAQINVINHYRLRPHVPADRKELYRHMREFLNLKLEWREGSV